MKRLSLVLLVATTIILASHGQAAAQCVGHSQLSLTGSWQLYINRNIANAYSWTRIPVIIGTTGTIQNGTTAKDAVGTKATVTGGSLILNVTNCKVSGSILIKPTGAVSSTQITVNHATLSLDDQTIMGVGSIAGKPFTFTGVKVNTF